MMCLIFSKAVHTVVYSLRNCSMLYKYEPNTIIGQLISPHLTLLRSSLLRFFDWSSCSPPPGSSIVSFVLYLCSYSLIRNDNPTTISYATFYFLLTDDFILHYPVGLNRGLMIITEMERSIAQVGSFLLTNSLTYFNS